MKVTGVVKNSHVLSVDSMLAWAALQVADPTGTRRPRGVHDVAVNVCYSSLRRSVPPQNGQDLSDCSEGLWWLNATAWGTGNNMEAVLKERSGRRWMQQMHEKHHQGLDLSCNQAPSRHRERLWDLDNELKLPRPLQLTSCRLGIGKRKTDAVNDDDDDDDDDDDVSATVSLFNSDVGSPQSIPHLVDTIELMPVTTTFTPMDPTSVRTVSVVLSRKPRAGDVVWLDMELRQEVEAGTPRTTNMEPGGDGLDMLLAAAADAAASAVPKAPREAPRERNDSTTATGCRNQSTAVDPAAARNARQKPQAAARTARREPANKLMRLSAGSGLAELPDLVFPEEAGDPQQVLKGDFALLKPRQIGTTLAKACTNLVWLYKHIRDTELTRAELSHAVDEYMAAHAVCSSTSVNRDISLRKYQVAKHVGHKLQGYSTARARWHGGIAPKDTIIETTLGLADPKVQQHVRDLESMGDPHGLLRYKQPDGRNGKTPKPRKTPSADPVLISKRRECGTPRCPFKTRTTVYQNRVEVRAWREHNHVIGANLKPGSTASKTTYHTLMRKHLESVPEAQKTAEHLWEHAQKTFKPGGSMGHFDLLSWPSTSTNQETADDAVSFQVKVMAGNRSSLKTTKRRGGGAQAASRFTRMTSTITWKQSDAVAEELQTVLRGRDKATVMANEDVEYHKKSFARETNAQSMFSLSRSDRGVKRVDVHIHMFSPWFMKRTLTAGQRMRHNGGMTGLVACLDHTHGTNDAGVACLTMSGIGPDGSIVLFGMVQRATRKKTDEVLATVDAYDAEANSAGCRFFENLRVFISDNDPVFKKALDAAAKARGTEVMGQATLFDLESGTIIKLVWTPGGCNYNPDEHACGATGVAEMMIQGDCEVPLLESQCSTHANRRHNGGSWTAMQHPPAKVEDVWGSIDGADPSSDREGEPEPTTGARSKRKMPMKEQAPFLKALDRLVEASRDCTMFFYLLGLFVDQHAAVWRYQIGSWLAGRYGKFGWMWWWSFIFNHTQSSENHHKTAKKQIVKLANQDNDVVIDSQGRLPLAKDVEVCLKNLAEWYPAKYAKSDMIPRSHYDWDHLPTYRKTQTSGICEEAARYVERLLMLQPDQTKHRPRFTSEAWKVLPVIVLPPIAVKPNNGATPSQRSDVLVEAEAEVRRLKDDMSAAKTEWAAAVAATGRSYGTRHGQGETAQLGDAELLAMEIAKHTAIRDTTLAVLAPQLVRAEAKVSVAATNGGCSSLEPRRRAFLPTTALKTAFRKKEVTRAEAIAEATRQCAAFCGKYHPFAGHRKQQQKDLNYADFDEAATKLGWFAYVVEDPGRVPGAFSCPFLSHTKKYCDLGGIDMYSAAAAMLLVPDWELPDALARFQRSAQPINAKKGQQCQTRPKANAMPLGETHWRHELGPEAILDNNGSWDGNQFDPKAFAVQDVAAVNVADRVTCKFPRKGVSVDGSTFVWLSGIVTAVDSEAAVLTVKYKGEPDGWKHPCSDFTARRQGTHWDTDVDEGGDDVQAEVTKQQKADERARRAHRQSGAVGRELAPVADDQVATVDSAKLQVGLLLRQTIHCVSNVANGFCYWCAALHGAGRGATVADVRTFLQTVDATADTISGSKPKLTQGCSMTKSRVGAALAAMDSAQELKDGDWDTPALASAASGQGGTQGQCSLASMYWGGTYDDFVVAPALKQRLVVFHVSTTREVCYVSATTAKGKRTTLPKGADLPRLGGPKALTKGNLSAILTQLNLIVNDALVVLYAGVNNHYEGMAPE